MRILLDTSTFLWWITDLGAQVSDSARSAIADPENRVFVSVASAWEISVKSGRGRLAMPQPVEQHIPELIMKYEFGVLGIDLRHALRAGALPDLHRDPFDRLLVAQGQLEGMLIATPDEIFRKYDVETIW